MTFINLSQGFMFAVREASLQVCETKQKRKGFFNIKFKRQTLSSTYKWSPQVGKLGGTGGKSACVPTCKIKFMPMVTWKRKWQWNNHALCCGKVKKCYLINVHCDNNMLWIIEVNHKQQRRALTQDYQLGIWTQRSHYSVQRSYL